MAEPDATATRNSFASNSSDIEAIRCNKSEQYSEATSGTLNALRHEKNQIEEPSGRKKYFSFFWGIFDRNSFAFNRTSSKSRLKTVKNVIVICAAPLVPLPATSLPGNCGESKGPHSSGPRPFWGRSFFLRYSCCVNSSAKPAAVHNQHVPLDIAAGL
jgi:hypothetical protein